MSDRFADYEATVKACGVAVARPQGKSWTPIRSIRYTVNMGTAPRTPNPPTSQVGDEQVHRRLMTSGWDGGSVVVRGRESRLHGEGTQRVSSNAMAMAGVRR